jgi:hypothetical protein
MTETVDWAVLLARWKLGDLAPEQVPAIALRALEDGSEMTEICVLAGLTSPTRRDVDDEIPLLLQELGTARPTRPQAAKILADEVLRKIVKGEVDAYGGARVLWSYSNDFEDLGVWEQLRPFVGAASEWEDDPERRPDYEQDIVEEATALLALGGLKVHPPAAA